MKLITFSLWGDDPKYCVGAIRNAELASTIYPGWTCRFYMGSSVPFSVTQELTQITKHWARYIEDDGIRLGMCGGSLEPQQIQIYHMQEPGDWTGMFWRFEPADEDDVEVFISRDCDSRLSHREADVVREWMDSPYLIHAMRDHPEHSVPILGGMWGAKRHAIPDMKALINKWNQEDRWQTDQEFLRAVIWMKHYHKVLAHDDWNRFTAATNKPFMDMREGTDFVGSIIGADEERLHPEHHSVL